MKYSISKIWLIVSIICIGCNTTSPDEPKINISISGTAVKHEDGNPLKDVKVVLYRTKPGFFRDEEERVSEGMTDMEGKFMIAAEVEESSCEEWSYWINAWLYIVISPEVPRQIDNEIPIQCKEEVQEFKLRLKK
ncbi:hypothetical protein NC796_24865 [Aliifodinibius sp. S!AR15-10]|uniref:hypothetical protein n=1 Tax=Aliifodinibius sp. S!AR15-10 TaxID=2950437 RepID=UPI0028657CED|nr:hypothetical protein [Aliifodinibius sp. S!AR15-10]MDR8394404.1 hypothetical protein [Aliifodinibius sp. S!AR15-10]